MSSSSSSTVNEADILACGIVELKESLDALLNQFQDPKRCYTLNELAIALGNSTSNAMEFFVKNLETMADRISSKYQDGSCVFLAGIRESEESGILDENPESASGKAPKRKEEYVKSFSRVSPLVTSKSVCPDFWLKSILGGIDIPVFLIEIVSGSENERSVRQTLLQAICNTVDLMRLYMNVFGSDVKVMELTSVVVPKTGDKKLCSAVLVTVQWGQGQDWQFQVSLTTIPMDRVSSECERITSAQFEWLKTHKVNPRCPKFLVRLHDLPTEMKQIPSKNSIVILEVSSTGNRVLKFTPRIQERDWLNRIRGPQTAESATVAVFPRADLFHMRGLDFFTYSAVTPPLARARLIACFGDFVLKTAVSLRKLHVDQRIAHLDVRTNNVGYTLSAESGHDGTPTFATAVFIDLDRGTAKIDRPVTLRTSGVECAIPSSWPTEVLFSAKRCDWRQWALMVWSVLVHDVEEVRRIYAGKLIVSGFEFLDEILSGVKSDWDEISEADLLTRINSWIESDDLECARESRPVLNTTKLVDEVRPYRRASHLSNKQDVHGITAPMLPNHLFYLKF
jgi:hypothetical protein